MCVFVCLLHMKLLPIFHSANSLERWQRKNGKIWKNSKQLGCQQCWVSREQQFRVLEFIIKSFFDSLGQGTREADHTHAPEEEEEEEDGQQLCG